MRKLNLLFILILSISLLTSCNRNISISKNEPSSIPSDNNHQIIIDKDDNVFEFVGTGIFFSDTAEQNGYVYEDDRETWKDTIEEKFKIELEIDSIYDEYIEELLPGSYYHYTNSQYEYLKELIETNQISGLFRLLNPELLPLLIEDNLIMPISPYLENNNNWGSIPAMMKEVYSYDGVTWGIPTSSSTSCFSRYYREDWLNKLNMDVPYTINDFYDVLKAFTYDDPDGDGLNNTRGADRFYYPIGLQDIFTAYDARPNPEGEFLPTLNPNSGVWEDSVIKPEYKEAMTFIIACEQEGVLAISEFTDNKIDFQRGISGSFGSNKSYESAALSIAKYIPSDSEPSIVYTPGLVHNIDKNLCGVYTKYYSPYVLLSSSKHPYSSLNILVDVFMADKQGYLLGAYGPEDYFVQNGDVIVYKTYTYNDKNHPFAFPGIMNSSPFYSIIPVPDFNYNKETDEYTAHNRYDRFAALKENDLCYEIPLKAISPDYGIDDAQMRLLSNMSRNMISWVLDSGQDLDYVITQYRNQAKIIGMQEFLDEQNEKLGKPSTQQY